MRRPEKTGHLLRPGASREKRPARGSTLVAVSILVASGVLAYANSFSGPFILDDVNIVARYSGVRTPSQLWIPAFDVLRPLGWWSFAVNYAISGTNVGGYHAANLAIHLAAALTLFGIVRRTLLRAPCADRFGSAAWGLALAVALLWLVHPLQTQSVTYISQRFESLMGLFFLLTLYSFIRAQESSRPAAWYGAAVACCLTAITVKEVAAAAPLLVLWYDRVFVAASWRELWQRRWAFYAGLSSSWVVLAAILMRQAGGLSELGLVVVADVSPWQYAATQPGVIAHYLRLSLYPVGLCLDHAWPVADTAAEIVPALALVVLLLALTGWAMVRWPAWSFLGAWFFLILAPTSSVVPIVDLAFEHRMYLPLSAVVAGGVLGGYLCGGWLLSAWPPRRLRLVGYGLVAAIAMTLGGLTVRRNFDYRTDLSIWSDTVRKSPRNARAHNNLAIALAARGQGDEAIAHYRTALQIDPRYSGAHHNLGLALVNRGELDEGVAHYREALEIDPGYADAHNDLGTALARRGEIDEAIVHYQRAVEFNPRHAQAYYNLGTVLARRGRFEEAIAQQRKAIEIKPDFADAHNNLAWILATCSDATLRDGRKAVEHAERAVQLTNNQAPEFLDTLAAAYAEAGRFPDAVRTARAAVALATQQNKQAMIEPIKAKIPLYESRKPFRQ